MCLMHGKDFDIKFAKLIFFFPPSDPERVFEASLTSAQVLLPGSQASVSSMLLEGHSLLALSTIMFAPGGIDQVGAL